jgi:site-specific DNA-methyltransferase (adenine-specific)
VLSGYRPSIESDRRLKHNIYSPGLGGSRSVGATNNGRWPANIIHDGSDEVMEAFAAFGEKTSGGITHQPRRSGFSGFDPKRDNGTHVQRDPDTGTAARFFY